MQRIDQDGKLKELAKQAHERGRMFSLKEPGPNGECPECDGTGRYRVSGRVCDFCAVGEAIRTAEEAERRQQESERRWRTVDIPRRFQGYRLESSPSSPDAIDAVRKWCVTDPVTAGRNLLLLGGVGTGKTGLAVAALWELHAIGEKPLRFVAVSRLLDALKPGGGDEGLLSACQSAAALALDDLGTTRGTDWERERIFALLNRRYEEQRPSIVTSNVDPAELAESIGERCMSRLLECCEIVSVDGGDLRLRGAA